MVESDIRPTGIQVIDIDSTPLDELSLIHI